MPRRAGVKGPSAKCIVNLDKSWDSMSAIYPRAMSKGLQAQIYAILA